MKTFMVQISLMNRLVQLKTSISKNKLRKNSLTYYSNILKIHELSVPQISTLNEKNDGIDSTKYQFENSQILYN